MATYYFTDEGNYGYLTESSVICDTSKWTMADWEEVENCTDGDRAFIARGIANKYAGA